MSQLEHQHATSASEPVTADEAIVNVDSVLNISTGNSSTIDGSPERNTVVQTSDVGGVSVQSAEGNPVNNNVQNSDGGAVVQPDAAGGGGVQAAAGGGGGRAAPGDTNMRRSRSFDEYMRDKRGWMMMVAALFVQLAFQAALQPPTWIPADWYRQYRSYRNKHPSTITGSAPSPSPHYAAAESPAAAISGLTEDQAIRVLVYVVSNTVTFATALTILVALLLVNRSSGTRTVISVQVLFVILAISCSATYALANSHEMGLMKLVLAIVALYAFLAFCTTLVSSICLVTVPQRVTKKAVRQITGEKAIDLHLQ